MTLLHEGMSIIHPGTPAKLGDVDVMIAQAAVRADRSVSYEVVWWDGKTRHAAWVTEAELGGAKPARLPVGFREPCDS